MQTWQTVFYVVVAVVVLIGCALSVAGERPTPGRTERAFATVWLLVRRLLCFGLAAAALIMFVTMMLTGQAPNGTRVDPSDLVISLLVLGVVVSFLIWVGIYGRASRGSTLAEDRNLHEERKKRYGWRL